MYGAPAKNEDAKRASPLTSLKKNTWPWRSNHVLDNVDIQQVPGTRTGACLMNRA